MCAQLSDSGRSSLDKRAGHAIRQTPALGQSRLPGSNQRVPLPASPSQDPQPATGAHPELNPLACSQARTSAVSECGLSGGSGARGPGAARLGPDRPWAKRACSSSLTQSIWENFSAGGKPGGSVKSGRRVLGSEARSSLSTVLMRGWESVYSF